MNNAVSEMASIQNTEQPDELELFINVLYNPKTAGIESGFERFMEKHKSILLSMLTPFQSQQISPEQFRAHALAQIVRIAYTQGRIDEQDQNNKLKCTRTDPRWRMMDLQAN